MYTPSLPALTVLTVLTTSTLSDAQPYDPTWRTRGDDLPYGKSVQQTTNCEDLPYPHEFTDYRSVELCEIDSSTASGNLDLAKVNPDLTNVEKVCVDKLRSRKHDRIFCCDTNNLDQCFDHLGSKGFDMNLESVKQVKEAVAKHSTQYILVVDDKTWDDLNALQQFTAWPWIFSIPVAGLMIGVGGFVAYQSFKCIGLTGKDAWMVLRDCLETRRRRGEMEAGQGQAYERVGDDDDASTNPQQDFEMSGYQQSSQQERTDETAPSPAMPSPAAR